MSPWYNVMKLSPSSVTLKPITPVWLWKTNKQTKKSQQEQQNIRQFRWRDTLHITEPVILKTINVTKTKKNRDCYNQQKPKEANKQMACGVLDGIPGGKGKWTLGKN